jgi:hypothetical protein
VAAGAGAGTTGIGGIGGAVSWTSGALARARPSAPIAPAPGVRLLDLLAGGTSDMVSDTTGILRARRRMITRRPPATLRTAPAPALCVVTARVGTVVRAAAGRARVAGNAGGVSFGEARAGKRATGGDSSGKATAAAAGGFTARSTDAVIRVA